MKAIGEIKKNNRLWITDSWSGGMAGYIVHPNYKPRQMTFVATYNDKCEDGKYWEHVSVALPRRCPTWDEMCMVKDIFWGEEECVIQFHPPKSQYVDLHPYCLHLWKEKGVDIIPPLGKGASNYGI